MVGPGVPNLILLDIRFSMGETVEFAGTSTAKGCTPGPNERDGSSLIERFET